MTMTPHLSPAALPRPRGRWKIIALVVLVFISGAVIGGAVATMFIVHEVQYAIHHPDEFPARLTARLTRRLSLTSEQSEHVQRLIDERVDHLKIIRREFQPKFRAELYGLHADVDKVLTPDQQTKWDKFFDDLIDNWLPAVTERVPSSQSNSVPVAGNN
jgi:hypothetical protein